MTRPFGLPSWFGPMATVVAVAVCTGCSTGRSGDGTGSNPKQTCATPLVQVTNRLAVPVIVYWDSNTYGRQVLEEAAPNATSALGRLPELASGDRPSFVAYTTGQNPWAVGATFQLVCP